MALRRTRSVLNDQNYIQMNLSSAEYKAILFLKKALKEKKAGDPTLNSFIQLIEWNIQNRQIEIKEGIDEKRVIEGENRAKRDEEYWPKLKKWIDTNVKSGTLLKMTGCQDGIGLREVIESQGDRIVCYKLEFSPLPWKGNPDQSHQIPHRSQITEHDWKKVLGPVQILPLEEVLKQKKRFTYTSLRKIL